MDNHNDELWALIWKVINDSIKLEVASYLILQARNEREKWHLRPHTRDGNRDIEQINNHRGTFYCEAKYRSSNKLALSEVGDDISNAILNKIDKLFITTNTDIRQDLYSFVEKFNHSEITIKRLTIELIDGISFQQSIIVEHPYNLYSYLNNIVVTGYKGKDKDKKAVKSKATYQATGKEIINKLQQIKNEHIDLFICNPRINHIENNINISDFFITRFAYIYNKEYAYFPANNVKITVGAEFICQVGLKNLFADTLKYRIEIKSNVGVQIFQPHNIKDGTLFIEDRIKPFTTEVIDIHCKVYAVPSSFEVVVRPINIKREYESKFCLNKKSFDNRLLNTPFLTSEENLLIEEFIRRTEIDHSKVTLTIFKGGGGVGKSTIINMICDRIHSKNYKSYRILSLPNADMVEIAKTILIDCTNIETLIKESDYAKTIKAMLLDDSEKECHAVIDLLFSNQNKKIFNLRRIGILATIVSNLLHKTSKSKRLILIIEDLHLASKSSLDFILCLIKFLNNRNTDIHIILSERIDIGSNNNINIINFYNILFSKYEKSINTYYLDDFSVENAMSLADHYVNYNNKDREFILKEIVNVAGRKPLNIIHFLLAIQHSTDAYFQPDGLLYIYKHNLNLGIYTINTILEKRFKDAIAYSALYGTIFCYLVLFKNSLPKYLLSVLLSVDSITEHLDYLQEHRFIFIDTLTIRFDHETLYRFFSNSIKQHLSSKTIEQCAINAFNNIAGCSMEIQINVLYYCPQQYDEAFNEICLRYIETLIDIEDKKKAIEYCDLFLSKHRNKLDIETILLCASIKVKKYSVAKEYSDINEVIRLSVALEKELDTYCFRCDHYMKQIDDIKCQLYAHLGSAYQQISNTHQSLLYLNKQKRMIKENDSHLCFLYNRLGVTHRMRHEIDLAISFLAQSLRLAFHYQNHYLIYHNYFDISGCFMALGNVNAARKYMYKAANIDSSKFGNRQQVGYIDCQSMLYYYQILFDNVYNINEIDILLNQAQENNFTWHYCNIANLRGIIELKEFRFSQASNYFKGLLSYCQTYTQSTKQKIYILNNLIISLYLQNNTNEAIQYIKKLINIIQQELTILDPIERMPIRLVMALLNLHNIGQFDLSEISNFSYKLNQVDEFCKLYYLDKYFYIIYR